MVDSDNINIILNKRKIINGFQLNLHLISLIWLEQCKKVNFPSLKSICQTINIFCLFVLWYCNKHERNRGLIHLISQRQKKLNLKIKKKMQNNGEQTEKLSNLPSTSYAG